MSSIDLVFLAALMATVAAIAIVDFRTMTIPDGLCFLLAALGLSYQAIVPGGFPLGAFVFAAVVLGGFWLVRRAYQRLRGVAGLGFGDVKMAGASALWFSPWNLPLFLLLASFSALVFVLVTSLGNGRLKKEARIPFGPFIGFGLVVTWVLERSALATFIPDRGFQ